VKLRKSEADRLLGSRVRIPLRSWTFDCFVHCVGIGLYDQPITHSEEFYRVCVSAYELRTLTVRRNRPHLGFCATEKKIFIEYFHLCVYWVPYGAVIIVFLTNSHPYGL